MELPRFVCGHDPGAILGGGGGEQAFGAGSLSGGAGEAFAADGDGVLARGVLRGTGARGVPVRVGVVRGEDEAAATRRRLPAGI